ncbi:helix-turn-helix domain-containing protein [Microbacterium indicum]|uniref:helix-turn-helix domain-containing protein n=1 Tax=Microbacterium indicum TaxID=358100 RepID=UPI000416FD5E|nr:XRE family transcriptional regulator [Microbacterium indicum]
MDDTDSARLGAAIRARRKQLGLTIVRLAELADLSHPFVSQVERGHARPSLDSLRRIALALGTSQIELMSGTSLGTTSPAPGVFGEGEARMLTSGDTRFTVIDSTGNKTERKAYFEHPEDEFVTVLAGTVIIDLGPDDERTLAPGDSAYYRGGTPHRWCSADGSPYRLIVVKERRQGAADEEDEA